MDGTVIDKMIDLVRTAAETSFPSGVGPAGTTEARSPDGKKSSTASHAPPTEHAA